MAIIIYMNAIYWWFIVEMESTGFSKLKHVVSKIRRLENCDVEDVIPRQCINARLA
jgi:hypothetical protein